MESHRPIVNFVLGEDLSKIEQVQKFLYVLLLKIDQVSFHAGVCFVCSLPVYFNILGFSLVAFVGLFSGSFYTFLC